MATYYSDYFTQNDESTSVYEDNSPLVQRPGEVMGFYATFTGTTALAASDKVRFLTLPKGAKMLNLSVTTSDHDSGTTIQVKLGYETTDDDAFGASLTHLQDADTDSITDTVLAAATTTGAQEYLTMTVSAGPATTTGTVSLKGSYVIV